MSKRVMWWVVWLVAVSSMCLVARAAAQPAGKLPTVRSAEELLADEIRKVLDAGHLRPVVANPSEQYWQVMRSLRGANMIEYWHNPAETIYTLIRALPHVPAAPAWPRARAATRGSACRSSRQGCASTRSCWRREGFA